MTQGTLFDDTSGQAALPEGAVLLGDWLSASDESELLAAIDGSSWRTDLSRRTQHYGYRYDYVGRGVGEGDRLGDLPTWAENLARRLLEEGWFEPRPNQVIVNEYEPGQGIALHADHARAFGPTVATVSLADSWAMDFEHGATHERVTLMLPRRSLLLFRGPSRYEWKHGIAKRMTDAVAGPRRQRSRRVSITFRTVDDAARADG